MIDPVVARKTWRTLEPIHGFVYFSPDAEPAYTAAGLKPGRMGYFASRSAPMGAVAADVVIATFFNFHHGLVRSVIPDAWTLASPAEIPIGVVTAFFGAPFFVLVLRSSRRMGVTG